MTSGAVLFQLLNIGEFGWDIGTHWFFWFYLVEMVLVAGYLGGYVWGIYLMLTCGLFGMHINDGFSAMQIDGYRNFLRIRIKGDELTIYPIGLERVPSRDGWGPNPNAEQGSTAPSFVPNAPLDPHLIEGPVKINAQSVRRA